MHDLNDLQFFTAVVGHRSFSAAARQLGVPKSRVSRRVAFLEERLGVRLLERSTRRLNVTEVGQQVYEHARAAIEEADAVEDVALRMRSEPRGLVRITCPHGLQGVISRQLPAFLAANPLLRLQVIATNRRVDLIEEGVDIAVRVRERLELASGRVVQVLADWTAPDGILHLVFTSRRGMLPGVRAVIDFAADALRAATD